MHDNYPPGQADNAFAPYNQAVEEDPKDDLFHQMCEYLDEHDSDFLHLHCDAQGWFFEKPNDETRYALPIKYWIVAQ